jgi:hypothetical protein
VNRWNPWVGAVVIFLGVLAAVAFAYLKIDLAILPPLIITAGITALQAASHVETTKQLGQTTTELVTLRASMRPPSLVDATEKQAR